MTDRTWQHDRTREHEGTREYDGTIGELLEELERARHDKADTAEATYTADGRPARISLDWEENAVDDEALYVISDYGPAR